MHRRQWPRRCDCVPSQVVYVRLGRTAVCSALGTTATALVVVLGAHTANAFRICMGRSRPRRFWIATGVFERKCKPGRIPGAKARTNLGSRGEHLLSTLHIRIPSIIVIGTGTRGKLFHRYSRGFSGFFFFLCLIRFVLTGR